MALTRRIPHSLLLAGSLFLCAGNASAASVHRAVVTRVPPVYPELAHRMHVGGKVVLLVVIQPDGSVSDAKVESGHALLTAAAQDAVRRWRFSPNPEASESEVEVNFNVQ
ncbi:MAG: TonB-like protein [Edaphobacter sp.]|nr:TonB-like protein [Edaphobacter sp.]